jgi:hypothetical protein
VVSCPTATAAQRSITERILNLPITINVNISKGHTRYSYTLGEKAFPIDARRRDGIYDIGGCYMGVIRVGYII